MAGSSSTILFGDKDYVDVSIPNTPTSHDGLLKQRRKAPSWFSRLAPRSPSALRLSLVTYGLVVVLIVYLTLLGVPSWSNSQLASDSKDHHQVGTASTGFTLPQALPHIPSKIWQIYLAYRPGVVHSKVVASFAAKSPSHTYSILDKQGAVALVDHVAATYPGYANIRQLFDAIPRTVIRADFLRFLLLAVEGGVYSDSDTLMVRPLADWVPDGLKDRTRLIVGIEADAGRHSMLIKGTSHRVQFCQWTLAGAPGHPALWAMVDRVLERTAAVKTFSDAEVLDLGGPAGWTEVVFEHLRKETGTVVTWENMTGMREPRLFGDTLVLPIDGFATGVPHSGSSQDWTDMTMVQHMFFGGWKDSGM